MNGNVDSLATYLKLSSDKCKEATEGLGEDAVDNGVTPVIITGMFMA